MEPLVSSDSDQFVENDVLITTYTISSLDKSAQYIDHKLNDVEHALRTVHIIFSFVKFGRYTS